MMSKLSKDVTTSARSSLNLGVKKSGREHWSAVEEMEPSASFTCKANGIGVVRMWRRWTVEVEIKSLVAPESMSTRCHNSYPTLLSFHQFVITCADCDDTEFGVGSGGR